MHLQLIYGLQGDILTFIRRVDEHWIEAKLGEKTGICPLQFTEVIDYFIRSSLLEYGFCTFCFSTLMWPKHVEAQIQLAFNYHWISLTPGRRLDVTPTFIQTFDSSVDVTPLQQSAEAES